MTEYGPEVREFVQSAIDDHGFLSWLNASVDEFEPGHVVMSVPYDKKLVNSGPQVDGNVHGGVAATLIDTVGGTAVRSALDEPLTAGVATIDLNVSYLRPAANGLVATGDVVRVGSTVGVAEVTVESTTPDGEQKEVAVGRGSYRIFQG
ncbi:PaaI family thioesterase [Halobacteriaceae archaeon GCM10025711]